MTAATGLDLGLEGRVIAIAGAGGGLGPSVARTLAAQGATIAATGRDQGVLDALEAQLDLPSERYDGRVVDLLDADATNGWCADLVGRFGRVDALLHLVGGWKGGTPIAEATMDEYEWLHDALVRTVQRTSQAFHDALAESGNGRFVLVSSKQAQNPQGTNAAYAATKAAAETWTLALAEDFWESKSGATANIIVVNAILTPQMREANPEKPYRTFASSEDIAAAIALVCSDHGAKMNGQRLSLHS